MPTIRYANPDDFHKVACLLKQLWPNKAQHETALKEVYLRSLESDHDMLLCAEMGDEVIGFGSMVLKNSFWQEGNVGYVTALVIDEEYRNKGIGRTLLDSFHEMASKRGCKKIELDSGFHREQAHGMYEHYGFEKRAYVFSKDV